MADEEQFTAVPPAAAEFVDWISITITFTVPVNDPVLLFASLGSIVAFPMGTNVVRLSGDQGFTVSGSNVTGVVSGSIDSNGTVRLIGCFSMISFSATTNVADPTIPDGIFFQIGGSRS